MPGDRPCQRHTEVSRSESPLQARSADRSSLTSVLRVNRCFQGYSSPYQNIISTEYFKDRMVVSRFSFNNIRIISNDLNIRNNLNVGHYAPDTHNRFSILGSSSLPLKRGITFPVIPFFLYVIPFIFYVIPAKAGI